VKKYSLKDLKSMLEFFEMKTHTPLLLHSSLFTLGVLEGCDIKETPRVLNEFFCENLEAFFQPAFNYSFPKTGFIDLTLPNSEVGVLSNEMIKMGYPRSVHPMFSFVGNSEKFIKPDFIDKNPFGEEGFFDRLTKHNGFVIVLGAKPFVATYIIYAEYMAKVKYRFLKPFYGMVKTKKGEFYETFYHFAFPLNETYRHDYCRFHEYLLQKGVSKEFKIGSSKAYGFNTVRFTEELKNYIADNPFRLLDSKPKYFYRFLNGKETPIKAVNDRE
jgi:aminoglycoside N3'-acetyltransferase